MKNVFNTAAIVIALALGAVGVPAQAQSADAGHSVGIHNIKDTQTRQPVINDYTAARKEGSLPVEGAQAADSVRDANGASPLTREQVKREAAAQAESGRMMPGPAWVR